MTAAAAIERVAHDIHRRGLTHGRTGNLAVRDGDRVLVTPTGVSLGEVRADALSVVDASGRHLAGPRPTKEAFLHVAMLRVRPEANAVVHTHSVHSAALSCLDGLDPERPLPPLTAYYGMRVGSLRLLPYAAPGDPAATAAVEDAARASHALLLRNHGPVVAGADLDAALDALEELEHTAQLFLLTRGLPTAPLSDAQVAALRSAAPRSAAPTGKALTP
ncbi:class II aldolase/adducin family protein [Leifsonia aquatica]|uniref:Ribulose-5-phosphate 4-epimerase/fuculose-1-phosphate aldolase n=3 Tax=Leifsonia aquatica TaxID=144185 RepID=A0A7W4UZX5_LEIAQ|nr:class II aldolase/adducin family protein [Leifsonia aquatica]MBB2969334.1 ribulose-5-phosphate 4-epimerase/fuculose-1-phosphate aldolase [Leifsonia aquatica]